MIAANELRIGNWVQHSGGKKPKQITVEDFWSHYDNQDKKDRFYYYEYIPLTPDILAKCGMDSCADGNEYRIGLPLGQGTDLVIEVVGMDTGPYDALITNRTAEQVPDKFSYLKQQRNLHQLQNLYFALTGTELNYQPK